ncbi:MAG: arginine--tRNA ligase [Candidatus Omnitrophica bacterium]|nr:arginine--tRNA ligase [Candidatus Omnitrophota bacterium]
MNPIQLFEPTLKDLLQRAVSEIRMSTGNGAAPLIELEIPRSRAHGDVATSIAMRMAGELRRPPLEIAGKIVERVERFLPGSPLKGIIEKVEAKPPGFVNFFVSHSFLCDVLRHVLSQGSEFGRSRLGAGRKAMVEFVSANPTGPLSVAHGRQAAVGDALANLLLFAGYRVVREYYLNDEGTQIELLGQSVLARARETAGLSFQFPENGYKGQYVRALGAELLKRVGPGALEKSSAQHLARTFAVEALSRVIRSELDRFGVRFGPWFPQSSLSRFGYLNRTLGILKRRGYLYLSEGAWWLKSTAFGDDKDRVVIRSDGRLTYIAADIAYHRRKFQRGFELLVNLWGPDHHGYIPRIKAAMQALGFAPEKIQVRIVQLCTLKRGKETIPMSTREGEFITLTQVMDEVGVDAARFFFLLRKTDAPLEFDLELAKKHSLENPVYYIQYAHARICNIFENRRKQGFQPVRPADLSRLQAGEEVFLLKLLREFPGVVESSAAALEPFGIVSYLQELAEAFHRFYDTHRVLSDDVGLSSARLDLAAGVRTVLENGLKILGVAAPEKM